MFGEIPTRASRWEQRITLDAAEHLKAIDYDLDGMDRSHAAVLSEVRAMRTALSQLTMTIISGIVIAVVGAVILGGIR